MLADADKLCEVLINLLHNAVDYNRDAGAIDVNVERLDDVVEIRITDTGIGISAEARSASSSALDRADPSRSFRYAPLRARAGDCQKLC